MEINTLFNEYAKNLIDLSIDYIQRQTILATPLYIGNAIDCVMDFVILLQPPLVSHKDYP
jgi:hypothetical protein